MKNKLYRLTTKWKVKTNSCTFEEGDQIFTHDPQNYPLENFDCVEWEATVPFNKKKHLPKRRRKF